MPNSFAILLHGVGSQGSHMQPIGEHWRAVLPGLSVITPDAPFPFAGGGHQWFSIAGVTADNRPQRVAAAREALDAVIRGELAARGFRPDIDRLIVAGFSQGAIMALDLLASGRLALHAVIAFSGRLASPEPLSVRSGTPLLLVHGQRDAVMPWQESHYAAERLQAAGARVQSLFEPESGHTVTAQGAASAAEFLRSLAD